MGKFDHLFQPLEIKSLRVENRTVMPAMATNYASPQGHVTDRLKAYYLERVRGGVGYVTIEHAAVSQNGKLTPSQALISSDDHIPGYRSLVDAIHREQGKVVIQIDHCGRTGTRAVTGIPIVSPSPLPCVVRGEMPHELSGEEIRQMVVAYGEAAGRVKKAGADGVEIHMAHGYLINQFLTPLINKRQDEYGGTPEKRLRMALEVLQAVRRAVGPDYPVICRISADEYAEGGLRIGDTGKIALALEAHGADALHVTATWACSGWGYWSNPPYPPHFEPEGAYAHLARAIRQQVKVPVLAVGRIRTPTLAERLVSEGAADLICLGRALIADPWFPRKAREGREDEIIPCISCNRCLQSLVKSSVQCAVNPRTGRELELELVPAPAPSPKKVWVIGGGPAGMKAAEVAAARGHEVVLFERSRNLGGQLLLAAAPPCKEVLLDLVGYLKGQMQRLGVEVRLGQAMDSALLEGGKPDVAVVATGAIPSLPPIEGLEQAGALSYQQVLSGEVRTGERVLVLGGGSVGAEVADYLSEQGRRVVIVEMLEHIVSDLLPHMRLFFERRLRPREVEIHTSTRVKRFGSRGVLVEDRQGERWLGGFDSLVVCLGAKARPLGKWVRDLEEGGVKVMVIGDAVEPRDIMAASLEGYRAALDL